MKYREKIENLLNNIDDIYEEAYGICVDKILAFGEHQENYVYYDTEDLSKNKITIKVNKLNKVIIITWEHIPDNRIELSEDFDIGNYEDIWFLCRILDV